jgi:hypothetical protein
MLYPLRLNVFDEPFQAKHSTRRKRKASDQIRIIQEDGAPGQGYNNRRKDAATDLREVMEASVKRSGFQLVKQPKLSPCTNVQDICVWHAYKSRMDARMAEVPKRTVSNIDAVEGKMWHIIKEEVAKTPARVYFNGWQQRQVNLKSIHKVGGKDFGAQEHTGIRKKYGTYEKRECFIVGNVSDSCFDRSVSQKNKVSSKKVGSNSAKQRGE